MPFASVSKWLFARNHSFSCKSNSFCTRPRFETEAMVFLWPWRFGFLRNVRLDVMWNAFEQNNTTPLVWEILLSFVCTLTCLHHNSKGHSNLLFILITFLSVNYYKAVSQGLETTKFTNLIGWNRYWKRSITSLRFPPNYNLRNSSDKHLLSYPRKSKATLGDRSFTCAAPKLWNALLFDIRSVRSVSVFKAKLKTHLFRHAFLS